MASSYQFHYYPATMLLIATLSLICFEASEAKIGACYGTLGKLPSPAEVVALCRQYHIRSIRIFNPNPMILNALRGSDISVMVGVPNEDIPEIAANPGLASSWVRNNVLDYGNVNFKYIAVGNEISPFDGASARSAPFVSTAIENIHEAIAEAGLANRIKVSTVLSTSVLGKSYLPSAGAFRGDISGFINPIVEGLVRINSSFLANVYPYLALIGNHKNISLAYATFTSPGTVVKDGKYEYKNLFDAMVDALYAALEKAGAGKLEIVVSETGWPSAGGYSTTVDIARIYNNNLVRHVAGGTPRRRGKPIETYIFDLFDDAGKSPDYANYYGLFYSNKQPKYPLGF